MPRMVAGAPAAPAASARDVVIELEDVTLAFGDHVVLDHLDLAIARGETTVIVGCSGSGKTVLLKLMMGLVTPDRGRVRVFGRDLATLSEVELVAVRARMAMLFQSYALFDGLSVEANVEFPLVEARQVAPGDAQRRAHELLEMLGLEDSEALLPAELSGGMRKRVSLARALVARPEVVLFDEPTTGLDPLMVERVDEMLALAKSRYAITGVVISHDLASVRRIADRVAFLHAGAIVFDGTYDQFVQCELPAIRAFLATPTAHAAPPEDTATTPVVELRDVHKWFGDKHVLRGVDLAIQPNRITVLIGGSGSGKSVLARLVMGLDKPQRGQIRVFGRDIVPLEGRALAEVRAHFGLVFQHAGLLDWLDVEGNVAFPLVERRRDPRRDIRARVDEVLAQLGLTGVRHRMPADISTGERKRVALARAIVMRPDILIYDEPTTGQDPVRAREINDMIVQTQERFRVTTIVISHDMASTFRIGHQVALLHEGRILACGTPDEVRASADPYVKHFVSSAAA